MRHSLNLIIVFLGLVLTGILANAQSAFATDDVIVRLQKEALNSDLAWNLLASLTSEVGPRMAGSEADGIAVKWAVDTMHSLGFDRVWTEPVSFPQWQRISESAQVLSPSAQNLVVTALGGSPSTGGPLEGEVIQFETLEALEAAASEDVRGKIVFLSRRMQKSREGKGYGETVVNRSRGPYVAERKGATALLIRSVGTDTDRLPHTGMMSGSESGDPVPSAALSNPDADNLMILLSHQAPVRVRLDLDVGFEGEATSYNIVGEFDGSKDLDQRVLLGAHLDSWDLGTGAVDDGAGVAIVLAAARMAADLPLRPRHGTRVVLYANEEQGVYGGKAYAKLHENDLNEFLIGAESDLGSDRIYRFKTLVLPQAEPIIDLLATHLKSLGIERESMESASGGADVGQMRKVGLPVIDLNQDASRYFDLHHTANDTLDKVSPDNLRQNLAAWVTLLYVTANSVIDFGPVERLE
jgi:Zn-dependent M28 family amino/carboxypeptidase